MTLKPLNPIGNLEVDLRTQLCEVLSLQKKKQLSEILLKIRALFSYRSQKAEVLKCHIDTRNSPSISFIQHKALPKKKVALLNNTKRVCVKIVLLHLFSPRWLLSGAKDS